MYIISNIWKYSVSFFIKVEESKRDIKIELLINAQYMLEDKEQEYICPALKSQNNGDKLVSECIVELESLIMDSIHPYYTLGSWYYRNNPNSNSMTRKGLTQYRIDFCERLIEYICENEKE